MSEGLTLCLGLRVYGEGAILLFEGLRLCEGLNNRPVAERCRSHTGDFDSAQSPICEDN